MNEVDRAIEADERDASLSHTPPTRHSHEIERIPTASSTSTSSSEASMERRQTAVSRVSTQRDLERHPTELSRIHTARSQHAGTI